MKEKCRGRKNPNLRHMRFSDHGRRPPNIETLTYQVQRRHYLRRRPADRWLKNERLISGADLRKSNSVFIAAISVVGQFERAKDRVIHERKGRANTREHRRHKRLRPKLRQALL